MSEESNTPGRQEMQAYKADPVNTESPTANHKAIEKQYNAEILITQKTVVDDVVELFGRIAKSVISFGADPTGLTDSSAAIQAAIDSNPGRLFFPAGTYLCNVTLPNKLICFGDGSKSTILKPFDDLLPVMTYLNGAPFWTYHSEIRDMGFVSNATKTGFGFAFSGTDPATITPGAEFFNNVKFYGCNFFNFEKGVLFAAGNIGTEFYSCGFQACQYGVYMIDSRTALMHAGNKYFFACEISSNDVGVYFWSNTDGTGGLSFVGTIIESNSIGIYLKGTSPAFTPTTFLNVWFESNGVPGGGGSTTVDKWVGTVVTPTLVTNHTMIIESTNVAMDGCFLTDAEITTSTLVAKNCRVELSSGDAGAPIIVNDDASYVKLENPYGNGLICALASNFEATGRVSKIDATIGSSSIRAATAYFIVPKRASKITSYGPSLLYAESFLLSQATTGSFNLTGSVVSDGVIYASCNEFTRVNFLSSEFTSVTGSSQAFASGKWFAFTLDFKVTAGSPTVAVWDRSASQFATQMKAPELNRWYTFASIGITDAPHTMFLDFQGSNEDCTWRISAVQYHEFNSRSEAESFIESLLYVES